jgi:hypothetical protein
MRNSSWSRCNGRLLLAILLLVGFLSRLAAQGFINGSFETGDTTGWYDIDSRTPGIPGGYISDGTDWGPSPRSAFDGQYFLALNNFGFGGRDTNIPGAENGFYQQLQTESGVSYVISFEYQCRVEEPPGYYLRTSWNGNETLRIEQGVGQGSVWPWHHYEMVVKADSNESTFAFHYNAWAWYNVDNVRISSVPESPATSAITASLLLISAVAHWARRKAA